MQFRYSARALNGQATAGAIEADSLSLARQLLRERGLFPVSLVASAPFSVATNRTGLGRWTTRITRHDLMLFTSQLVIMLRAGTELAEALKSLTATCSNPKLKKVLEDINDDVSGGMSFSVAIKRQSAVFGESYAASVSAGDASGKVPEVLNRLAELLKSQIKLQSIVVGAVSYPIVLSVVCFFVVGALILFVLPNFEGVFRDMGVTPPASTGWMFFLSGSLRRQWWMWSAGLLLAGFGLVRAMRTTQGRRVVDTALLRFPLFGEVLQSLACGRIFVTLGMMLQNGVPMMQALQLCQLSVRGFSYKDILEQMQTEVLNGRRLGPVLTAARVIPPGCAQMITTAEQSGNMATVMQLVGDYYEGEAQRKVQELAKLLEPIIIIVMGFIVAFVVSSVMLPMLDISSAAGK